MTESGPIARVRSHVRRLMFMTVLAAAALLVTACDRKSDDDDNGGGGNGDPWPLGIGSTWTFQGVAHYDTDDTTVTDTQTIRVLFLDTFASGRPVTALEMTYAWACTVRVYKDSDCVLYFWSSDTADCDTMLLLPLEQGRSWTQGGGAIRTTVTGKEDVTVPAGNYPNCWKLMTTSSTPECTTYAWLSPGTGEVMEHNVSHDTAYGFTIHTKLISVDIKP